MNNRTQDEQKSEPTDGTTAKEPGGRNRSEIGEDPFAEGVVARFGDAVLIRLAERVVLRGGSMADRMEALEWMALFMPDAVASLRE